MPDRLYIPSAYVDEICPPGRAHPDAWIGAPAGDAWLLATGPDIDLRITLRPGVHLAFAWVQDLGEVLVDVRTDGTHQVRGEVPDGVTHFSFSTDVLTDSLDEFVREWRELVGAQGMDEEVLVRMTRWCLDDELFQFVANDRGPRFIRAAPGVRAAS